RPAAGLARDDVEHSGDQRVAEQERESLFPTQLPGRRESRKQRAADEPFDQVAHVPRRTLRPPGAPKVERLEQLVHENAALGGAPASSPTGPDEGIGPLRINRSRARIIAT